jgi:hypothetical protein
MQLDFFGDAEHYLAQLKTNWRATIENDGGHCPCCDKWGKISPFTITETHALALLWLSKAPCDSDGWVDVPPIAPAWMLRGKNYTTMAKWGLIEQGGHDDTSKRSDGFWRVTAKGLHFLCGTTTVPRKAFIYNNKVQGWSDECVSFRDCFGRHFDYADVMADNFNLNGIKL